MNNSNYLWLLICPIILFSCKDTNEILKPKFKTTIYRGQKGETEVTNFNRKQAEREKSLAETLEKAEEALKRLDDQKKCSIQLMVASELKKSMFNWIN